MEAATATEARRFGKYTLVAKLATGGMAEIFLARLHGDGGFEKLVCIKRILPHLAKDPQFVAMFLDEARVAARISHPNVCQVFELGEWEGQYYIAMEYLEGVPLSVFRRKDFYPMLPDPRLVAGFGVQACEGLHHAQQLKRADGELLGVIHRDISPQNLFATTDGVVKVLDFGIAKVQDASVRTSTGAVKGTYAYMAPEQLRNETLDRRVDVWAIGAVLWETLAQRHLFKRDTEFLTFEAITKLPIPDIFEVRPDVPPLLADTIARALSRNPEDRFSTARALGEALAQAVGPLGGAASSAQISDEVSRSFEATLAEQRMLLRIAREGGQFDLDKSSPLVGHGTKLTTTPVSNIKRRAEEAQAEVAHFVAATQAIEALEADATIDEAMPLPRPGSDGAFTPAPSRRSSAEPVQRPSSNHPAQRASSNHPAQRASSKHPTQRPSKQFPAAPDEWSRYGTEPPVPFPAPTASHPVEAARRSRLPWIIALIAICVAGGVGVLLFIELREMKDKPQPTSATTSEPVVMMKSEPAKPAVIVVPDDKGSASETKVTEPEPKVEPEKKPEPEQKPEPKAEKKVEKKSERPRKVEAPKKAEPKVEAKVEKKPEAPKIEPKIEKKPEPAGGPPGTVQFDSTPVYAIIYVDGKKLGETPLVTKLPAGKHSVRAVSSSGSERTLSINIESGKTTVRRIEW